MLILGLGLQAFAEYSKQRKEDNDDFASAEHDPNRCPGDSGFDSLSFGRDDLKGKHNIEANTGHLAMLGLTGFLLRQLSPAPAIRPRFSTVSKTAAGVVAGMSQAATAAQLRDNGFGVAEIAAIIIPWIFMGLSYLEWESRQPPTDNVTADPRHSTDDSIR